MKNTKKLTPILAFIMLAATVAPAYALDVNIMGNLDTKIQDGRMYKGDNNDKKDDDKKDNRSNAMRDRDNVLSSRIKAWAISAGTIGTVTAVSTNTLTVKIATGELYTVTTTDATIRRGQDGKPVTPIVIGETVYIFGIKNGTNIVASTIIVGKSNTDVKPTADESRQAYLGVVTAKTDTTLTIVNSANVAYTVTLATDAQLWINKTKQTTLSGFVVGDNVMVQGTLTGSNISAKKVMAMHLPVGTIIGKITVVNGTTLTVLGTDNKTYIVLAGNAVIKAKGSSKVSQIANLTVGDQIIVKGDLAGTTLTASTITEEKFKGGFFHRFGLFFKGVFGKK